MKLTPETADDVREVETIQGKRKRLYRFSRDNALVNAVMMNAAARGLSGEDTMTWLAYEALLRVEMLEGQILDGLERAIPGFPRKPRVL